MMRKFDVSGLKPLLESPKKIVITTHHKPDGDAMGSSLGLYNYLIKKNHTVNIITPSDYPDFLHWLPGNDKVIDFSSQPQEATAILQAAELLFCLDFNTPARVEKFESTLNEATCIKVMLDHHLAPSEFCDFMFSYSDACATAELVFDFIVNMGDENLLNKDISTCLYTGIMTDTGSFRFASTTADVHRKIARLIEGGADNNKIHQAIADNSSEDRLRLLGHCLTNKLRVFPELHVAYMSLNKEELESFQHKVGDTEGFVNYALSIKNIKMAAFFVERTELVKISFRSRGDFSVRDFAEKHFEGGGHKNASGGRSMLTLEQTLAQFERIIHEYKPLLDKAL